MSTKHGSWHLSPTHNGQAYDIGADDGANIALVYGPKDGGPADFLAKARLIAAAPNILDALRRVHHTLTAHGKVDENTVTHEFVRIALAAAEDQP